MGRSTREVVGSVTDLVVDSVVGSVTAGLKEPSVFGCSLRWGFEKYIALISDSILVEPLALPVSSSSSSSIMIESSKICQ